MLLLVNLGWMVTALSVVTTRYRDVQQLIGAVITILFLVTPIFWEKKALSATWIYELNPFTYFIDVLREPLLGGDGWSTAVLMLSAFAVAGWTVAFAVFGYGQRRMIFWL